MPSAHVGIPVYLHQGQFSAYGTDNPVDQALGAARRMGSYRSAASTGTSHSDILHAASATVQGASNPNPQQPAPYLGQSLGGP
jgi:hypothetical protein